MMNKVDIDVVWHRIITHQGGTFHQMRGKAFTYSMQGAAVIPSTTNRIISRSQFEKALEFVPLEDTVSVQHLQGPSYIYAILMDDRIRINDW
jgi:hypothetical protein